MSETRANEEWRTDPVRLAAVRRQIDQHQQAFTEALDHVRQAHDLLARLGDLSDDRLLDRCRDSLNVTYGAMRRDADFILADPTDAYLGNRAAFGAPTGWTPTLEDLCDPDITTPTKDQS